MTETTILLAGADPRATPQYQDFIWSVDGEERRFDLPGEIDFLKPNGLGGYKISVSALSSWSRCPLAKFYDDRARYVQDAPQPKRLSATQFGSVMHVVLMQMDRAIHEGEENALEQAIRTFEHYWDPNNITAICERVDTWIGKQTYGGLRDKGRTALRNLYEVLSREDVWRLAHEYHFAVPIIVNGRTHTLNGFVDRLSIKKHSNRRPYLCTDDWKGLPVDTPIPTPGGWVRMGDLRPGDQVIGGDGRPANVIGKSEVNTRPCYRITFDDRSEIVADNVHLWTISTGETLSTDELYKRFAARDSLRILNGGALQLPEADLGIDPYLLGAWLGDGNRWRGVITKGDDELFEILKGRGHKLGKRQVSKVSECPSYTILGLQAALSDADLLGRKFIPGAYLRGSARQRVELLRGLMDTDGTWNKARRRAVFCSGDLELAHGVHELVVSLGWKARLHTVKRTGFGRTVDSHEVHFTPVDINPFALSRKADLVDTLDYSATQRPRRRLIKSIVRVGEMETACIAVDSPGNLYLCGEQMVPTHNSGKQHKNLRQHLQGTAYSYASTLPEFWLGWPDSGLGELEPFSSEAIGAIEEGFNAWGFKLHRGSDSELPLASRRFRWGNVMDARFADGGWRSERDYARLALVVDGYVRAREVRAYSANTEGEVCGHCSHQTYCGGIGLAQAAEGAPL